LPCFRRPTRRRFTAAYKVAILDELDRATEPGSEGHDHPPGGPVQEPHHRVAQAPRPRRPRGPGPIERPTTRPPAHRRERAAARQGGTPASAAHPSREGDRRRGKRLGALAGTLPRGRRAEARAMIATAVTELAWVVGVSAACAALAVSRATHDRRDRGTRLGRLHHHEAAVDGQHVPVMMHGPGERLAGGGIPVRAPRTRDGGGAGSASPGRPRRGSRRPRRRRRARPRLGRGRARRASAGAFPGKSVPRAAAVRTPSVPDTREVARPLAAPSHKRRYVTGVKCPLARVAARDIRCRRLGPAGDNRKHGGRRSACWRA